MNNQQTNIKRLVRKTGSTVSETGEGNVRWVLETVGKSKKLLSGLVIDGFRANEAPKTRERVRHYNLYGGAEGHRSDRGGEINAG